MAKVALLEGTLVIDGEFSPSTKEDGEGVEGIRRRRDLGSRVSTNLCKVFKRSVDDLPVVQMDDVGLT